jgi:hypothetical protein
MYSPRNKRLSPIVPPLHDIGTLNPEALSSPVLRRPSVHAQFDTVAALSATIANLKAEHDSLQGSLSQLINSDEQTRFTKFKKAELDFSQKLSKREAEIEEFGRFLDRYRMNARPTFVEVDASAIGKSRKTTYDLISASLLVSNDQRGFFTKSDIERQNHELRSLIDEQEETLRLLDARLKLFNSFQQAHTAEHTLNSLRRGYPPLSLSSEAPTIVTELRTKLSVLSNELAQLVSERKELAGKRITAKLALRKKRLLSAANSVTDEDLRNFAVRSSNSQSPKTPNTSQISSTIEKEIANDLSLPETTNGEDELPQTIESKETLELREGEAEVDQKEEVATESEVDTPKADQEPSQSEEVPIAATTDEDSAKPEEPETDSAPEVEVQPESAEERPSQFEEVPIAATRDEDSAKSEELEAASIVDLPIESEVVATAKVDLSSQAHEADDSVIPADPPDDQHGDDS